MKKIIIVISLFLVTHSAYTQIENTINKKRLYASLAIDAVGLTGGYLVLNEMWYADYPQSNLHWFNDCNEWRGMDKFGHAFSSYHLSNLYSQQMLWSGMRSSSASMVGAALGFISMSTIELLDAKSEHWGASICDLTANLTGSALFLSQELLWREQKVSMKYSYHQTDFPAYRPEILGQSLGQKILKDYNGQTYWLSANVRSFINIKWFPKFLNFAVGYGATGMLGGKSNPEVLPFFKRESQFLVSLDIDLRKIPVKSRFLKKAFSVLNIIKIPMPTLELRSGNIYGHYLYF